MGETRFYHLERQRLDQALPALLTVWREEGARIVVEARSQERVDALDEKLWTFTDESFLAHGSARDGDPEDQPIWLTTDEESANGARRRVIVVEGGDVAAVAASWSDLEILVFMFDGRDAAALEAARALWKALRANVPPATYWREGEEGGWQKAR